jgi:hypothetical protein
MNEMLLFAMGLLVTIPTLAAVILIGRSEAQDPAHNRSGRDNNGN